MKSYFSKPSRPIKGSGCARLLTGGVLFLCCRAVAKEETANRKEQIKSTPPRPLGDLPLIVMTAGTDPRAKLQDQLASLSTNSTHIVVKAGDHALQFFQPQVIIDAVKKMVNIVRSKV